MSNILYLKDSFFAIFSYNFQKEAKVQTLSKKINFYLYWKLSKYMIQ